MRNLAAVAIAAFLAACGSSSKSSAAPPPASGTVGGRPFTPLEAAAITLKSTTPCAIQTDPLHDPTAITTIGVDALELKLTSYAGACGDIASVACVAHANQQAVTIVLARANLVPPWGAPPSLDGDYVVSTDLTAFQFDPGTGFAYVAFAEALAPGAACAGATPHLATGTVHVDKDTGPVTGSVDLHFDDGSAITGSFSAALCPTAPAGGDVCAIAQTRQVCDPTHAQCL